MALHFVATQATNAHQGDVVVLDGAEAHHAAVVRRVRVGERVTVGDGRGVWLEATCERVQPKEVRLRVTARQVQAPPAQRLVLAQALAKGDRDELAVQAATELGIDEIVPWQSARSVSRWGDGAKAAKGIARWESLAREAAKQAHRSWIPAVSRLATTADLVERARKSRTFVLEPTADMTFSAQSSRVADAPEVVLLVGPEGGIGAEELIALSSAGALPVRLGDTVLRTSTAGPAAIAVLSAVIGRW